MNQQYKIIGGTHHHYNNQQPIPFEKRDQRQTAVFTKTELEEISQAAAELNYAQLSPFIVDMVKKGIRLARYENLTIGDILK